MRFKEKAPAFSWALYDFANTLYSMNVVSLYFPLWLTVDKGLPEIAYSAVYSGAIILAAFLSPWLGALSDKWKSRKGFLGVTTFICIFFASGLSFVNNIAAALSFFLIAHLFYVLSLVFYNALMPAVSGPLGMGRTSGLGVGIGYVGTILGLLVAQQFHGGPWGRQGTFLPTGILFFLFALPLFIWVPEKKAKGDFGWQAAPSWHALFQWSRHSPKMRWFLLTNFLCGDAVHTVILFMSVFCKQAYGFSDDQMTAFYIFSTVSAIIASFIWGKLHERMKSVLLFRTVLVLWCATLLLGAASTHPIAVWSVGPLVGIALAGTWVVSRVLLIELSPPERVGEYFGLYNLTGKSAAVLGPLVWAGLLIVFSALGAVKYRLAILSLLVFLLGALWALDKVAKTGMKRA